MLKKLNHRLFLTCKQATYLMELDEAKTIKPLQKIRLNIHLILCHTCKIYARKKAIISLYFTNKQTKINDKVNPQQIEELKNKILQQTTNFKK